MWASYREKAVRVAARSFLTPFSLYHISTHRFTHTLHHLSLFTHISVCLILRNAVRAPSMSPRVLFLTLTHSISFSLHFAVSSFTHLFSLTSISRKAVRAPSMPHQPHSHSHSIALNSFTSIFTHVCVGLISRKAVKAPSTLHQSYSHSQSFHFAIKS